MLPRYKRQARHFVKDPTPQLFNRIEQAPNLTTGLIETLLSQIQAGTLRPGQRLPTEQAIVEATGVSRTVVREALASLRARGLIVTRQGLGAFVADADVPRTFSIDAADPPQLLQVLELRLGLEPEAAALAAERRSVEDLTRLRDAVEAISVAIMAGSSGADEDQTFHRRLLDTSGNPYFGGVFAVIGSVSLRRQRNRLDGCGPKERLAYMQLLHREHSAILDAIVAGDPGSARRAMRRHLNRTYELMRGAKD
jgi:GntR family transcriptional regulator, transcriptional repressor for pyruvate dehydrogenase complex